MTGHPACPPLLLLGALTLAACNQPPTREIAAAETALAQARKDGAEAYAAERWKEAEAALAAAQQKAEQKDYRGAFSAAMDASERSKAASQAAAAAKMLAKSAAEVAQAEVQAALDDVAAVREEATQAKVPDTAFAELEPRVEEARQGVTAISDSLSRGDLLEAQKAALDLKAKAATLAADFRDALQRWQEAHPRGRRGAKPTPKKK